MRVGRSWHAARILRDLGADTSDDPGQLLLLARAESGWGNWPEVALLLERIETAAVGVGPERWWLLARAHEDGGRWESSVAAYRTFLEGAGPAGARAVAALPRLARAALAAGKPEEALAALSAIPASADWLRSWAALEGAESRVASGDTAWVVRLLANVRDEGARDAAWSVAARARLAAGDRSGAEKAYLAAREPRSDARRAEASTEAGLLALARGDSSAAWPLLVAGLEAGPPPSRARAAGGLLSFRGTDMALTLRMAEILEGAGDVGPAQRAYDRAARLADSAGVPLGAGVRLARARLLATVPSRREEALEEFRAIRSSTPDPLIGARNLELWARLRDRQGRTADAATVRTWLLDEYPSSPEAAEVMWARGQGAESRGDREGALAAYAALAAAAPEHTRAGEARMRAGQILLGRGSREEAAGVYEAYLRDFPEGRRWEEASYWGARARLELGDTAQARRLLVRLRREAPVSYYSVMAAHLLGETFDVEAPPGQPAERPPWLGEGLSRLDLLEEAGLVEGAEAEESRLVDRARGDAGALLALAEALLERGRTVTGINLGWDLRREGAPWDLRLLRVVYPFPNREMVVREAAEWGLDPMLVAAVIRQESAFRADIRSRAGAVGLMQVLPSTGRDLARRLGPRGFREGDLEVPDVNLHLGAAFFLEMSRRYGDDLHLVLSAYNAGPARAARWRRYPEASDPERFTESIPLEETRGYVKNVRRNLDLYRALYGHD